MRWLSICPAVLLTLQMVDADGGKCTRCERQEKRELAASDYIKLELL